MKQRGLIGKPNIRYGKGAVICAALSACLLFSACSRDTQQHGNLPVREKVSQLRAGVSDKSQVAELLGSPSSPSTFNDDLWYYVSQRRVARAFLRDGVLHQTVVALAFDSTDVLQAAKVYHLKDGRPIRPDSNTTPTSGKTPSLFEQLFGNIGRFTGSSEGGN